MAVQRRRYATAKIDHYENEGSSETDMDDLSPKQQAMRRRAGQRLIDDLDSLPSSDSIDEAGVKLEFSDSENDGAAAYKAFREKHYGKKKRLTTTNAASKIKKSSTGVGLRAPKKQKSRTNRERVYGAETSDETDDAIEQNLPEYLKQRRGEFRNRVDDLGDAGLRIPPSYDDVDFLGDARLDELEERPHMDYISPPAAYDDLSLKFSAGIIPASIAQWLKPYQIEGVAFLHKLFVYQKGGILGDDMGLGKTIQVIAALTAAFGKTGDERDADRMRKMRRANTTRWYPRVLIICPGSLIDNWKSELDKWGWWSIYTFHGSAQEKESALKAAKSGRLEILITTYRTYVTNEASINAVPWDCVIADECHAIKERKSDVTKAMDLVNALCRIGLTGTAIQNKYEELWTMLNWANPGRFGPISAWKLAISEPLKLGQSHDATAAQLSKARKTAKKLVQNLLPEFFLRRMKSLIAHQLPKKTDRVVFCPLTETQSEAYETFVQSDMVSYIRESTEVCDCGSGDKRGWCCYKTLPGSGEKWQNYVFPCMNILRNLSSHIGLLIPTGNDVDKLNKELDYLSLVMPNRWQALNAQRENISMLTDREFCGKWRILQKLLRFWHENGDKVLIFSYSIRLLDLLKKLFATGQTAYNVSYLDGTMKYEDRTKAVDDFNSDPDQFVFLISTRAGGVGLNITSANKVVVVDPNWNPSYDLQAQDRAYRIGQTRDVEVFRLISTGTIEEIVYARQIYKQQQSRIGYTASVERRYFKGIQDTKEKKGEIFGLKNLFAYQGDNIVLRDIVNKTNIAESRAGVMAVGLDVEDHETDGSDDFLHAKKEEREDDAMSQLAALIQSGETNPDAEAARFKKRKAAHQTNAISGILANAGVTYTHENSEVVGTSKVEAQLSKRAEEAGMNDDAAVFAPSQQHANEDIDVADGVSDDSGFDDDLDAGFPDARVKKEPKLCKGVARRYHPEEDIRLRQFCTMAKEFGFDDPVEFALLVEGWTQRQRRTCLDRFYDKLRRGNVDV